MLQILYPRHNSYFVWFNESAILMHSLPSLNLIDIWQTQGFVEIRLGGHIGSKVGKPPFVRIAIDKIGLRHTIRPLRPDCDGNRSLSFSISIRPTDRSIPHNLRIMKNRKATRTTLYARLVKGT